MRSDQANVRTEMTTVPTKGRDQERIPVRRRRALAARSRPRAGKHADEGHELGVSGGLAALSLDALSSVAYGPEAMITVRPRTVRPHDSSTSNGLASHLMRTALVAMATSAPNFCACTSARPASARPEMPVGKPR